MSRHDSGDAPDRRDRLTGLDTVAVAAEDPHRDQPWAELGLKADEYAEIREILGRRPTSSELAMYTVMWSEHCSYKSTKVHLKQFSEIPQETRAGKMLAGIGENAGVIDIGQGYAVTFKVESHNHPSYVEPYQGAATGVGGIVRDILAMGARPVAVMDPLRFGPLDDPDTHRVLPGIVAGVGGYGNCLGLPNIGGEVVFDATYAGNPLVNALCVGVLRHEDLHLAKASGVGNQVILYGARTGGDGIGGVSVLASETFEDDRPGQASERPGRRPVPGEAADRVHARALRRRRRRRHPGPRRRRALVRDQRAGQRRGRRHARRARPGAAARLLAGPGGDPDEREPGADDGGRRARRRRARSWRSAPSGTSRPSWSARSPTATASQIDWHGERVVDVPPRSVAHDGPTYQRPYARPDSQDVLQADGAERLPRPGDGDELRETLLRLVGEPQPVRQVLDHRPVRPLRAGQHRARPAQRQRHDPRRRRDQPRRRRLATDCNGRFARLDPYAGAQLALAESYRNVSTGGATPVAISDCLNFGSPEDPAVMWQFAEACRGLKDACLELGIPVTGGNVSLYNQTGDTAILPTPVVAVLGVIEDVTRRTPTGLAGVEGARPASGSLLLGETREELSGSEWAHVVHGHLGGLPPNVDLAAERALSELLVAATGVSDLGPRRLRRRPRPDARRVVPQPRGRCRGRRAR